MLPEAMTAALHVVGAIVVVGLVATYLFKAAISQPVNNEMRQKNV